MAPTSARRDAARPPSPRTSGAAARIALRAAAGIALLALALALSLTPGARSPSAGTAEDGADAAALTVTTVRVARESWPESVTAAGPIVPWQEASIGAPLDGLRLTALDVDVGDAVVPGQVLARFDDRLLRAETGRLRAALAQADALALQARRDAERARRLGPSGALSEQAILAAVTAAEVADAARASAQAALHAKAVERDYAVLRAEHGGVISARLAAPGAVPRAGDVLLKLIRDRRLEWHGEVAAQHLRGIRPGQAVTLELPDGSTAAATVRLIAPTLGADTRLAHIRADLAAGGSARAGMYASGRIAVGASTALPVPAGAVVVRDGRPAAFVVERDGTTAHVRERPIATRRRQGRFVEVTSGLAEGVEIVAEGAGFLSDGARVRIAAAEPAAAR